MLFFRPRTLLLDGLISTLEADTRGAMHSLLRQIRQHTRVTVLHVTHSRKEAEALADRVFRIDNGHVCKSKDPSLCP